MVTDVAIEKKPWQTEWDEKKAQIRGEIAKLGLEEDYEEEVIYAALLEYLHVNLGQDLREEFGERVTRQEE
jgi:hypothetical protein